MKFLRGLYSYLAFFVLAGLFNLLCFISRDVYTTSFYISVGFGNFSLLLCLLTAMFSSAKRQIALIYSYYYLTSIYEIIAVALNLIFIWCGLENNRVNIAINSVVACIFIALILWSLAADADTNLQAKKHTASVNYHYDMVEYVLPLRNKGKNIKTNKKLEALYDAVANSQINTDNADVYDRDQRIISKAKEINEMIIDGVSDDEIIQCVNITIQLVEERNSYVQRTYMRGV